MLCLADDASTTPHLCSLRLVALYRPLFFYFFFFNDTPTPEIYTLSLHDALPIFATLIYYRLTAAHAGQPYIPTGVGDRKSTRLNSSHANISYAVFCLKKKKGAPRKTPTG